jgi:hypothetical protein
MKLEVKVLNEFGISHFYFVHKDLYKGMLVPIKRLGKGNGVPKRFHPNGALLTLNPSNVLVYSLSCGVFNLILATTTASEKLLISRCHRFSHRLT